MKEAKSFNQAITIHFSTKPSEGFFADKLTTNQQVFRVITAGQVTGDLNATMLQTINEVHTIPSPSHQAIAITFKISQGEEYFEGYYAGSISHSTDQKKWDVHGYGQILSVTGVFAELFMAEVFVTSEVPIVDGHGAGENGEMIISPRHIKRG